MELNTSPVYLSRRGDRKQVERWLRGQAHGERQGGKLNYLGGQMAATYGPVRGKINK